MGCASLGSRVAPGRAADALARALDAGVSWFDVAPAYGAGAAEEILGAALRGHREDVQICTKVGLLPPPGGTGRRMLRAALRPAVAAAAPLRGMIRRSGATANRAIDLTPDLLRGSLERSLTRLGTDRVEVYALHNARAEDLARDEIRSTLVALVAEGKARTIAVAGDAAAAAAALDTGAPFGVIQIAQPAPGAAGDALLPRAAAQGVGCVTHSVFGVGGALQALSAGLKRTPDLAARARAATGIDGPPETLAAALLMARARAANPAGVGLASMAAPRSLAANVAAAARPAPDPALAPVLADIVPLLTPRTAEGSPP